MTWLLYVVSGILTLAGGMSVISGAPIIQVERGWAEVIAGTVAISGGVITFALAALHGQLRAVRRGLAQPASPVQAVTVDGPASDDLGLRRTIAAPATVEDNTAEPVPPVAAHPPAPTPDPEPETPTMPDVRQGLWKRIRGLEEDDAAPSVAAPKIETFSPADLKPIIPVLPPEPSEPAPTPAIHLDDHHRDAGRFDTVSTLLPRAELNLSEPEPSIDWLDRGLQSRPTRPTFLEGERAPASPEAAHDQGREDLSLADRPSRPVPIHDVGPLESDAPGLVEEPAHSDRAEEVSVIGRYQAGVASYVMYSDGTIEVEGEGGSVRRFDSMDDLRAFIARQDTPAA